MGALLNDFDSIFLLEMIALGLILVVCCYASYTDIHFRIISNFWSWAVLICGMFLQIGFWSLNQTTPLQIGLTLILGFAVAYILYAYGFWAPGDAKLFWSVTVAMPPTLFHATPFFSMNASLWALLVNTVLVNLIILVGVMLYQRQRRLIALRQDFDIREWLSAGVELFGLEGVALGLGSFVAEEPLTFSEAAAFMLVLYMLMTRFLPPGYSLVLVLPGIVLGGYVVLHYGNWPLYLALGLFVWFVHTVYMLIRRYYYSAFVQILPFQMLREGMVPCQMVYSLADGGLRISSEEELEDIEEVLCYTGRSLSAGRAHKLRELAKQGRFRTVGDSIEVETPMPFAVAICIGVIPTAILGGNMAEPAVETIKSWM